MSTSDYNLEPTAEPLIWYILEQLRQIIQPPNDSHMMGGGFEYAPRGTLNVPKLDTGTEAVTNLAIRGFHKGSPSLSLTPAPGAIADLVLHDNDSPALNPSFSRTTIRYGTVVVQRIQQSWILPQ
ncbi:hypothetical protein L227DRAFT_617884 [Lentinus tigrinus ALCF2SS1-6]|uniref:Uncharacterized protein n=1 Tax=Lentinus tigrinus ALCF2SS1-6 TaxID=1328759 RepID=A0A5C2RMF9_9APHY|nr:hypothetical protein L227DRAFT_617884 [Lentinus tigrinus ALCF2SS1-6]